MSHNALQHFPECHGAASGGVPCQVQPGGYPGGGGTLVGGTLVGGTLPGGYPTWVPPRPGQVGGGTQLGQLKEYSLHGGRYASCVHAGGLSCYSVFLVLVLKSFYCLFPFMFLFYSSFLLLFLPFFFFLSFFYFSSSLFFIPSLRLLFCLISLLYHSSFPSLSLPFFELSSISLCLSIFIDGRVKVRLRRDHSDGVNVSMRKLISGHR